MARLRQQHPQNYVNSGNIHTDFENLVRYINAAELGNKTVGELFGILFDEEGVFRGPIQLRVDSQNGLQYRVGQYNSAEEGWLNLVDIGDLRGPSGSNAGTIEGPFFFNRNDRLVTAGVGDFTISTGGTLYDAGSPPTVTFSAPDDDILGSRPTATATVTDGAVTAITVTDPGSGYITAPTVTISAPENAQGTRAEATVALADLAADANVISYTFDPSTDDVVVYRNGLLLSSTNPVEYVADSQAGTITISEPSPGVQLEDKITIYSIRSQSVTNFRRDDILASASPTVPFVHTAEERILVWRNGILQEEGGSADYLANPDGNTVTFNSTLNEGDKVTIMTVENQALKTVAGLMFEDEYTDDQGFIRYNKLSVNDDEIPQTKVFQLSNSLSGKANLISSNTAPTAPQTGDLWLDVSQVPAVLKFYDGTQWLETSPESSLPTFIQSNANQYVRVNGTGTALEYGDIDTSALVPKTFMGAANGVATLDTAGQMPVSQLPETFSTVTLPFYSVWEDNSAAVSNKTYFVSRLWKQTIRIDGLAFKTSSGSCTIQLSVDGVTVGQTYTANSTQQDLSLTTVIEIDATTQGKRLEIVVTNNSTAQNLEVGIAAATVNV